MRKKPGDASQGWRRSSQSACTRLAAEFTCGLTLRLRWLLTAFLSSPGLRELLASESTIGMTVLQVANPFMSSSLSGGVSPHRGVKWEGG